ncbi:type II secretion system protein [Sutcliffiella halmapala]|uniref:type II secretion system protein n=1 Tax=Sutcliffiella halmapala TaxID=79882 RepID=UPI000995A28C|nr:type II secretion system protein [Sutcliffiella halmapala]
MWKLSNGFTLLEVLATMVVWMITITLLLPALVMINQERNGFTLDREARFLLNQELESKRSHGDPLSEKIIEKQGRVFQLIRKEDGSLISICVKYQDYRDREKTRCVYWHE